MQDQAPIAVLSFYCFTNIEAPEMLIPKILLVGKKKYIHGTVLLAREGFNGSISGTKENVDLVLSELVKLAAVRNPAEEVNIKYNYCEDHPFMKLKVKIKKEIVTMGVGDLDILGLKGQYVDPANWDEFIQQDDVILIDTRNDYEVEAGTFKGAINPMTETFRQFPDWAKDHLTEFEGKKVAMCCTGGIRCEKSTALMRSLGLKEVYHLKGGILQYLEDTQNKNNLWQGDCFVFDDRRAVDEELHPVPDPSIYR